MKVLDRLFAQARVRGKSLRHAITHSRNAQAARVVLVSGVQRSGTNMLMDALERHWDTDVYHEYDSRAFERYYMRDMATISALHSRCKARFFVIKALLEAHLLREIGRSFPGTRFVWVFRNYADMINSHMVSWPDSPMTSRTDGSARSPNVSYSIVIPFACAWAMPEPPCCE